MSDPQHDEGRFAGVGGVEIWWQAWLPEGPPRATVALAHGLSEHSSRYGHVAAALNERGYAVWALDHRGHGRSGGTRAMIDRVEHAVADLDQLVVKASEAAPGRETFLIGHSMGGWLAIAYTIRHQARLAGLILSGPVAVLDAASSFQRMTSGMLSRVAPKLGVYGVPVEGVSRDPEVVRDYEEDPLNFHGKVPVRTIAEMAAEIEAFPEALTTISIPILIVYGGADPIVPIAGAKLVAERVSSADRTLTEYDGLYHEILNEPERGQVIAQIGDWLDARAA